jgi:hypothetical protein
MEKTVAKTIVKADPQRHLCVSTSATAELIAVDNPEAFSCPKCLQRLKPPVFQVYTYNTSALQDHLLGLI